MSTLYQNSTKDGLTGYALTKPSNTSRLRTVYNKTKGIKTVRPGMAKIGEGVQGVVFLAGTSSRGERNLVIKVCPADKSFTMTNQPAVAEYKIQKALYKIAPRHIARPIRFFRQDNYVPIKDFDKRNTKIFDYSKLTSPTNKSNPFVFSNNPLLPPLTTRANALKPCLLGLDGVVL